MNWQKGQSLDSGKYIVEKILGLGCYGIAYRAREVKTGKLYAIKTLNQRIQDQPDFAQIQVKFINQAITLASCWHPNIVRVYPQLFQEDNLWCMVMDYVQGPNLAEYLREKGKLSESEGLKIIQPLGEALNLVHERGFLHRDVKPNSILFRQSDQIPVLMDCRLEGSLTSKKWDSITKARTECYLPIEQYEHWGEFGAYTDVYSLAATLYTLVTGELPFPAQMRKHNLPLVPPKQHNESLSDRLNEGILKGMELEPQNRPQSVSEWLDLLHGKKKVSLGQRVKTVVTAPSISQDSLKESSFPTQSYREILPGGIPLEMLAIKGGQFLMGSPNGVGLNHERPQHRVDVFPFFLGKYPITQEQYQAVMGENPSAFKGSKNPVECVSWYDAMEFCIKLSQLTGKQYRLPSEAEWEYACRGGTQSQYYFGDDGKQLEAYAWYDDNSGGKTHPLGEKKPNQWGLYDLHGNVWEWCLDDWHGNYDGASTDGRGWFHHQNAQQSVSQIKTNVGIMFWYDLAIIKTNINGSQLLRGGSWYDFADYCRSANRFYSIPDIFYNGVGFRVVSVAHWI